MPISALVGGKERIAPLLSDTEWQVLQDFCQLGTVKVQTSCCHAPATPVDVKGGYRFFEAPKCTHSSDSVDSIKLETAIIRAIVNLGWSVQCDVVGGERAKPWKANVLAVSPDGSNKIGFVVSPVEPGVADLGVYAVQDLRMANSGIASIFLFPTIPTHGMWKFVREGKFIAASEYSPGGKTIGGLDVQLYVDIALDRKIRHRTARIRALSIETWARRSEAHPDDSRRFDCGADVSYLGEHITSYSWDWMASGDVMNVLTERSENIDELLLLMAELCMLDIVISHFADSEGEFYHARYVVIGILIKTSGVGRIDEIIDDLMRGGYAERYYAVYPGFVNHLRRGIAGLKSQGGYIVARAKQK